jgi:hypothetical protein
MRPLVSLRWIVLVVALVVGAVAASAAMAGGGRAVGSAAPAPSVGEAVRRTRAAGSARVVARLRPRAGAAELEVTGVTSLVDGRADIVARAEGGDEVAVRVAGPDRAWLRQGAGNGWTPIDPAAATISGAAQGWGDLLGGLRAAGGAGGRRLAVTRDGTSGTIELDGAGRIRRLRLTQAGGRHLDLTLSDFGVAVDVEEPPPP